MDASASVFPAYRSQEILRTVKSSPSVSKRKKSKKGSERKKSSKSGEKTSARKKGRKGGSTKQKGGIRGKTWTELYVNLREHIWKDLPKKEWEDLEGFASMVREERAKNCTAAMEKANMAKNRYGNILPYDNNRVKLSLTDSKGSDYISATHIITSDLFKRAKRKIRYIAASAPLVETVESWYRMVWEIGIPIVLMLTRCIESNRDKCFKYWPDLDEEGKHGDIAVKNIEEKLSSDFCFIERKLMLTKSGETKYVKHLHYLAWPDHDVPDSPDAMEEIIRLVNETYDNSPHIRENPLLIHCSAGIGRTGTFIVLHTIFDVLERAVSDWEACGLPLDDPLLQPPNGVLTLSLPTPTASPSTSSPSISITAPSASTDSDLSDSSGERPIANAGGPAKQRRKCRRPPTIDIKRLVQHIRDQRGSMLTKFEQYEFCYKTVLGYVARKLGKPTSDYQTFCEKLQSTQAIPIIRTRSARGTPLHQNSSV